MTVDDKDQWTYEPNTAGLQRDAPVRRARQDTRQLGITRRQRPGKHAPQQEANRHGLRPRFGLSVTPIIHIMSSYLSARASILSPYGRDFRDVLPKDRLR